MPSARLKLKWPAGPADGVPSLEKMMRSIVCASVAVPTVDRAFEPMRSWSTTMEALSPSSTSTSGLARLGMNDCTKAV